MARYGPIEPWFLQCCMHTLLHGENMNFFFEQHLIHCCMADLVKVKIPSANWYGYHNNLRMFQGKNYNYNLFRETCFRKKIPPATTLLCCIPFNTGLSMQHSPRYFGASVQCLADSFFRKEIPHATTLLCCIPFNTGLSIQHSPRYYGASLQSLPGNLFQKKNTPCYYAALLHSIQHRSINAT